MITEKMKSLAHDIVSEAQASMDPTDEEGMILAAHGNGGEIFACNASGMTAIVLIAGMVKKICDVTPKRIRAKWVDDVCLAIHAVCDQTMMCDSPIAGEKQS